jgi:ketol-acid reductoisomerase
MAFLASRSSQALRAASRRAPRAAKSANAASYSLLATTRPSLVASALASRLTTIEVLSRFFFPYRTSFLTLFFFFGGIFFTLPAQSVRGIKTLDFAGSQEVVYERSDWPLAKLQDYFKNDTLALIGYGSQGHGQGLNARDNGLDVIVGVRENGESWKQALEDGWVRFRARGVSLSPIAMC